MPQPGYRHGGFQLHRHGRIRGESGARVIQKDEGATRFFGGEGSPLGRDDGLDQAIALRDLRSRGEPGSSPR